MIPKRHNSGFLAKSEARALDILVGRLPAWMSPDRLTTLGMLGALLGAIGFGMGLADLTSLGLVILGMVMNWFGDSLDGRLARHRHIERKIQGFILDNGFDLLSYLLLALGFAVSGLVWPAIPFILLALYVMLSNLALARMLITGVHELAVGKVGTSEVRVGFLLVAVMIYAAPMVFFYRIPLLDLTVLDFMSLLWACLLLYGFAQVFRADLRSAGRADARTRAEALPPVASSVAPPVASLGGH